MKRSISHSMRRGAALALAALGPFALLLQPDANAASGGQPQASITLKSSNVAYCNKHENAWSLSKVPSESKVSIGDEITWTITATKTSSNVTSAICADGYLEIQNTGSANATIGNIVVNLQGLKTLKKSGTSWVSLAADMADSTAGENAESAKVVAAASSEILVSPGFCNDAGNYCVAAGVGTFSKSSGTGKVLFTDAGGDEVFSITPQTSISPGATVKLFYSATFNLVVIPGTALRTEAIVTFGNSGARGGSGASLSTTAGVDINGSGGITPDENNVRSVASRVTGSAPGVENCNDSIALSDTFTDETDVDTTVTPVASTGSPAWGTISTSGTWTYKYTVVGPPGGSVTNSASADGSDTFVSLQIGLDELGQPIYQQFPCCVATDLSATSKVDINTCQEDSAQPGCGGTTDSCLQRFSEQVCFCIANPDNALCTGTKNYCSYTVGGYRATNGGTPGGIVQGSFISTFTSGMTIGGGFTAKWTATSGGLDALRTMLVNNTGKPGALDSTTVDANSVSGGKFAAQVATLSLNVGFSGVVTGMPSGFGALVLHDTGGSLDGQSVSAILAAANIALGGGSLPSGYTIGGDDPATSLNKLVDYLNQSYDNCLVSDWGKAHLSQPVVVN